MMRYSEIIFLGAMLSATPLYAQSCGDDVAGLTVDADGNYVMVKPKQHAKPATANMSIAPASRIKTTSKIADAKPVADNADATPVDK